MKGTTLLKHYEQLDYVTEQMLISAHKEDWNTLLSWQSQYSQLSENIKELDGTLTTEHVPTQCKDRVRMYIQNILSYQQQISQLVTTRHAELGELIGEKVRQQSKIENYQHVANLI